MQKTHIISVLLGLENVEGIKLEAKDFNFISLESITEKAGIYASDVLSGEWHSGIKVSERVKLSIKPEANKHYDSFGAVSDRTIFERLLKFGDIVDITVTLQTEYGDTITETYEVLWPSSWSGEFDVNPYQLTRVGADGSLIITIDKDNNR